MDRRGMEGERIRERWERKRSRMRRRRKRRRRRRRRRRTRTRRRKYKDNGLRKTKEQKKGLLIIIFLNQTVNGA